MNKEEAIERLWQPMETAPKDGSAILVCSAHADEPFIVRWWTNRRCGISGFGSRGIYFNGALADWMTLPTLPKFRKSSTKAF